MAIIADPQAWRLAIALRRRFGEAAFGEAVKRARAAAARREFERYTVWMEIAKATFEIERPRRSRDRIN